ncbi:TOM1-like protein 2 [Silene latifolia]|uniref:TOM1-like protein 2 n=1 Tax=Silene latifolia TaxID=37657 RepID=UPI003D77E26F
MDKSKLATIGERLKSSSAQMSRIVTLKMNQMKELLQTPTPESRIVDQATSPSLESPDWGLNLRICSLVNGGELGGAEIVRAIKRKIVNCGDDDDEGKAQQRLALELLEVCAMNCEKVFSEIAAEKVVEEMVVSVIDNPKADREAKVRVLELVRAWGESEDLNYLPVFRQTYENLKGRAMSSHGDDGTFPATQYSLESYIDQQPVSPPASYPMPGTEPDGGPEVPYHYGSLSVEQKKEFLEITRNSLEVLSSLLSSTSDPKVVEDDLTINMLDKCKESQPVLQRIVQSTTDDESLLFEALNLNDELQKVISKFEEMHVSIEPSVQQSEEPKESEVIDAQPLVVVEASDVNDLINFKDDNTKLDGANVVKEDTSNSKPDVADLLKGDAECSEKSKGPTDKLG